MKQINFRINEDGYTIIKEMADKNNLSVAELSKQLILEKMKERRLELALDLFSKGKIGLKRAWKISGITPFEFRRELIEKDIEPYYNEKSVAQSLEIALSIDIGSVKKGK